MKSRSKAEQVRSRAVLLCALKCLEDFDVFFVPGRFFAVGRLKSIGSIAKAVELD